MKITSLAMALAAGLVGVSGGCRSPSADAPAIPLHEYLEKLANELRYRDEQALLSCFVRCRLSEPFILSIISDREGKGTVSLKLKLTTSAKATGGVTAKVTATPEIGVTGSAEATQGSESEIGVSLSFLDPGTFPAEYKAVRAVFESYALGDICQSVPEAGWVNYDREHADWWPSYYHFETSEYYVVDSRTRAKFNAMVQAIHAIHIKWPEEKKPDPKPSPK